MNGVPLLLLFIYSGFTLNLVLQCALGIKGAVESTNPFKVSTFIKSGIIFVSCILLWLFFSGIFSVFNIGILIYIILFPVSFLVYEGLEFLIFRYVIKEDTGGGCFVNFPGGITAVSVFLCMAMANNILEVIILSFGFVFGIFIVNLIICEIRRRAALEAVPHFLRGKPLVLITMGMLSLIFTTASLLLFRMIEL